jgi:CheY-specific phosphatase CheX
MVFHVMVWAFLASGNRRRMSFDPTLIPKLMEAVAARTRSVFESETGISVIDSTRRAGALDVLALQDVTAIVGVGGSVSLLIAFSFERKLIELVCERYTAGLDLADHEREFYIQGTAGELVNTIVGLCTIDIQQERSPVSLTPPVIIDEARRIHRPRNAVFASMMLTTADGSFDVNFVGPMEMFDDSLNQRGE